MEKVKTRLQTLPERLTHPTQVPIGVQTPGTPPLVLMNGHLKHTNEILVLLGDNWFVQRSAKQSIDILERRLSKTKQMIDDFKKEKSSHEKWMETVSKMQQESEHLIDLQEEFDDEAEKRWREHHREKVRAEKVREREERLQGKYQEDGGLMRRMEQLELEEERGEGKGASGGGAGMTAFTGVVSERPPAASSSPPAPASSSIPVSDPKPVAPLSKFAAARKHR